MDTATGMDTAATDTAATASAKAEAHALAMQQAREEKLRKKAERAELHLKRQEEQRRLKAEKIAAKKAANLEGQKKKLEEIAKIKEQKKIAKEANRQQSLLDQAKAAERKKQRSLIAEGKKKEQEATQRAKQERTVSVPFSPADLANMVGTQLSTCGVVESVKFLDMNRSFKVVFADAASAQKAIATTLDKVATPRLAVLRTPISSHSVYFRLSSGDLGPEVLEAAKKAYESEAKAQVLEVRSSRGYVVVEFTSPEERAKAMALATLTVLGEAIETVNPGAPKRMAPSTEVKQAEKKRKLNE